MCSIVQPWCSLSRNYGINGNNRRFYPHICHPENIIDPIDRIDSISTDFESADWRFCSTLLGWNCVFGGSNSHGFFLIKKLRPQVGASSLPVGEFS
jgi:hypothetical protein